MYNEFHKLYEEALAAFIEKQGASVKNFYREIRQAFEENENSDVAVFAKIMMATCDFDIFMMLMRETAETWQRKRDAEGKQSADEASEVPHAAAADYGSKSMPGDAI